MNIEITEYEEYVQWCVRNGMIPAYTEAQWLKIFEEYFLEQYLNR